MTCANLGAFCEGELSAPDAIQFRAHLPTCEACQRGLEDWMQIAAHASDALPRFEAAKLERVKGAIAGLGKDAEPPAGWQGRVMDAVAWQERVRQVVREAFGDDPNRESNWPRVEEIADRVAEQLASAGLVLSAEERETVIGMRQREADAMAAIGHLGDEVRSHITRRIAILDLLLGVSR